MKYDENTPLGLDWAGLVEVQRPTTGTRATTGRGARLGGAGRRGAAVVGDDRRPATDIEYMAFPRLPGIAELGWSPASTHDWDGYRVRLAAQGPRWDGAGHRLLPLAAGAVARLR